MKESSIPDSVLEAYDFTDAAFEPITVGLVNRTYAVTRADGTRAILQRLNPVFAADVNVDLERITDHLASRGLETPRLVRTRANARCVEADGIWRVVTFLDGRVFDAVDSEAVAFAAGALAGRFHHAVADLEHRFAFTRPGAHDTPKHMAKLQAALAVHASHPEHARIDLLAREILEHYGTLSPLTATRARIIHGDLKITNLLFEPDADRGLALLDLDTLQSSTYAIELGDALRSWCNPLGESSARAHFDLDLAKAALTGWMDATRGLPERDEVESIPLGVAAIAVELASRFATDALEDRFFGWDASRYASRVEHNLARAASQLALSRDVASKLPELSRIVRDFGSKSRG